MNQSVKKIIEEIYKHNDTLKKPKRPLAKKNWNSSISVNSVKSLKEKKYIKPKEKLGSINLGKIQR